jgi:hypothetical protein
VHSPTFNLVNIYTGGRLTLFHLDLYRLTDHTARQQILTAGLEEYLTPMGVAVIEWAEKWFGPIDAASAPERGRAPNFPAQYRAVSFETLTETKRRIVYEDFGA